MTLQEDKAKLEAAEQQAARINLRLAVVNTPEWGQFIGFEIEPNLVGIEAQLLDPRTREGPLDPYSAGLLHGRREALLGLMFTREQLEDQMREVQQDAAALQSNLDHVDDRQVRTPPPRAAAFEGRSIPEVYR